MPAQHKLNDSVTPFMNMASGIILGLALVYHYLWFLQYVTIFFPILVLCLAFNETVASLKQE